MFTRIYENDRRLPVEVCLAILERLRDVCKKVVKELTVRDATTWTILQKDGPNHLGLRYNVLLAHQMALITSGYVPFSRG